MSLVAPHVVYAFCIFYKLVGHRVHVQLLYPLRLIATIQSAELFADSLLVSSANVARATHLCAFITILFFNPCYLLDGLAALSETIDQDLHINICFINLFIDKRVELADFRLDDTLALFES